MQASRWLRKPFGTYQRMIQTTKFENRLPGPALVPSSQFRSLGPEPIPDNYCGDQTRCDLSPPPSKIPSPESIAPTPTGLFASGFESFNIVEVLSLLSKRSDTGWRQHIRDSCSLLKSEFFVLLRRRSVCSLTASVKRDHRKVKSTHYFCYSNSISDAFLLI